VFISRLVLSNFRSHAKTELVPGKVNVIRGPNAVGKSSVAAAVEYVLTGRCLGLDEAGRGAERLLRFGTRELTVEATLTLNNAPKTVNSVLTRSKNGSGGNLTMKHGERVYVGRQVEEMFEKRGFGKSLLSAALRAGRFGSLSAADQKELLADLMKPEAAKVPPEIQAACKAMGFEGAIESITIDQARENEEYSRKVRAECTAALREIGEPVVVEERPAGSPSAKDISHKLDSLRSEQNSLTREKEKLQNQWADKNQRIREIPELIAKLSHDLLSDAEEKKCLGTIEHESEINAAKTEIAKIEMQIEELELRAFHAKESKGKCPTCGHEADTDTILAALLESAKAAKSRIPGLQRILDKYPIAPAEARELTRKSREATVEIGHLKKEQAKLPKFDEHQPPNTTPLDAKIEELEGRIVRGQSILAQAAAVEERRAAYLRTLEVRKGIQERHDAADQVAKWCGPSGVQAQMTGEKLPAFAAAVNAILGRFGYECAIAMDPYSVRIWRSGSGEANRLDITSLSESEQWRFSLAFQCALAKASDVGVAIFDRADVLVAPHRGTLMKTMLDVGLDQCFVLASVSDKTKLPDEFTVWDLALNEAGETTITRG
jgi:DNA repair exonuclease SbcCD ATPase subunit